MASRHDLDMELTNALQSIALLKSQVHAGHIDAGYFLQRLDTLNRLLVNLKTERQESVDAAQLAKLYEVSRAIGSSLNQETVLNQVMDAIIALTGAERGFLMLLNDDGVLEVSIARNLDQQTLDSGEFVVSRTIVRQVVDSGEPVVTTNAAEDPRYLGQASIVAHQLRSIMAAPLRARGNIIGVIYVDNRVRTALFREKDLELLQAFAGQAGVAIDNARLFSDTDEKLAQRVEELTMLQWIDRQLNENLDAARAMELTTEWAARVCKAENASLAMLDKDKALKLMAQFGDEKEGLAQDGQFDLEHPLIAQVMKNNQAALEISEDKDHPRTVLCVPVQRENKTIGVMTLTANRDNAFDTDAQALVARMADRAAIAIENARLYNEVKEANQAKSVFVGTVAHELKVPMTSISGYADLLLQLGGLNPQQERFTGLIKSNVIRMGTLVQDLSDISRIESGNLRVEITDVDIREVIEQAKESVMSQIEERNHHLQEEIEADLPGVKADHARSVQVLVNLLSNAYKYTPSGGKITIRAEKSKSNGRVLVSVQDTGVGMSEEEVQKLGTKFWRSDNDHSLKQSGTGLGFSITQMLIKLMNASLDIQSQPGKGSTFIIGLPVSQS